MSHKPRDKPTKEEQKKLTPKRLTSSEIECKNCHLIYSHTKGACRRCNTPNPEIDKITPVLLTDSSASNNDSDHSDDCDCCESCGGYSCNCGGNGECTIL